MHKVALSTFSMSTSLYALSTILHSLSLLPPPSHYVLFTFYSQTLSRFIIVQYIIRFDDQYRIHPPNCIPTLFFLCLPSDHV